MTFVIAVFTIVGVIFWCDYKKKKSDAIELKKNGFIAEGEYMKVYARRVEHHHHRHHKPGHHERRIYHYYVICKWKNPRDEKYYIFSSYALGYNPKYLIEERGITKFPIYIDKTNVSRYYMDLDILDESAGGIAYEK